MPPKRDGSYRGAWQQYQDKHRRARLIQETAPVVSAARFVADAWQEQLDAAQGWCEEALEKGYEPSRLVPDLFAFYSGMYSAAHGLCESIFKPAPTSELDTDEESEMAGPVLFAGFSGARADIEATNLVDGAAVIHRRHIMLRVLPGNRLMLTLVGIRDLAAVLPAGIYRGTIRRVVGGAVVAQVVNVHRRLGPGPRIVGGGSVIL